jgi:hypothetical protein
MNTLEPSKKQYETVGNYFSIVARPEGPPIVSLQVGAALLHLIYCWSPNVLQIEYNCNHVLWYTYNYRDSLR